ncbi:M23 family metallopeptidase [Bacillus thuringiensis]|nr:M23 family metallopeptidase [Bacillus thuringiensis]MED2756467.1 M23 family metallopeptidase [Bacillus thuringiensis]MED2769912.1 M23 family metallopeptidase [Bacillus thuringiensis]MED2774100.1 M23 family metallopeptidase [Bacillus thuringiensis]MED2783635.1 M23 family metallopeptidase [Bacillus thuringiensis]
MDGKVESAPGEIFHFCVDPTNPACENNPTLPYYLYNSSPLMRVLDSFAPLKDCGKDHLGARDLAYAVMSPSGHGSFVVKTKIGDPVFAAESGEIIQKSYGWPPCGCNSGCINANSIAIRSDSDGHITNYVHVNPLSDLKAGDHVNQKQQIGAIDVSGDSCGPHLHMARMDQNGNPTCNWDMVDMEWLVFLLQHLKTFLPRPRKSR